MRNLFITMLCAISMAASAQEVNDSVVEPYFEEVPGSTITVNLYTSNYKYEISPIIVNSKSKGEGGKSKPLDICEVVGFNPMLQKIFVLAPSKDDSRIERAVLDYFNSMETIKNNTYTTPKLVIIKPSEVTERYLNIKCDLEGIKFESEQKDDPRIEKLISDMENEAWEKLLKRYPIKVKSYDPYKDKCICESVMDYGKAINDALYGANVWVLDKYITEKTKGQYSNVADFQKALKANEEAAVKYAKKMK